MVYTCILHNVFFTDNYNCLEVSLSGLPLYIYIYIMLKHVIDKITGKI